MTIRTEVLSTGLLSSCYRLIRISLHRFLRHQIKRPQHELANGHPHSPGNLDVQPLFVVPRLHVAKLDICRHRLLHPRRVSPTDSLRGEPRIRVGNPRSISSHARQLPVKASTSRFGAAANDLLTKAHGTPGPIQSDRSLTAAASSSPARVGSASINSWTRTSRSRRKYKRVNASSESSIAMPPPFENMTRSIVRPSRMQH